MTDMVQSAAAPSVARVSDAYRWAQLAVGVAAMVMIANYQYGWTFFVPDIQKKFGWDRASIQWAFTLFVLFETWLVPKRHGARFEDAAGHEYEALARLLKALLRRMNRALETPSYNLIIHTAPFSEEAGDFYHWHVELIPKLTKVAGFERGSGFYINPTSPEEAARVLRDAKV